jgi:hypothetical protein
VSVRPYRGSFEPVGVAHPMTSHIEPLAAQARPVRSRGSRRMCPSLGGVLHVAPRPFDPAACPREIDAKYRWRGHKSSLPTWTSRSQPALRCQDFREAVLLTACAVMEIVRARRQASQFAICSMPRATTP